MKLTPYVTSIAQSTEKQTAALAPQRAEEVKKRIELKIAELDTQRTTNEVQLAQLAGRYPVDLGSLMNAQDNLAITERQIKQLKEVHEQLFPVEPPAA